MNNERIRVDFGIPLLVLGTLTVLVIWNFYHNHRLDSIEKRLQSVEASQRKYFEYVERITDVILKMQTDLGYVSTNAITTNRPPAP